MDSLSKHWHVVIYLLGVVFVAGTTIASSNASNADQDKKIEVIQKSLSEDDKREVQDARDIARIKANQERFKEDIAEIKEEIKDNSKKLDKILEEVRNR